MTTSLTTFENHLRSTLLDLLAAQWRALGVPLSASDLSASNEVIDPEALLWCSLEFLPTEVRLRESALSWLAENPKFILRRRWKRAAKPNDPRSLISVGPLGRAGKADAEPSTGCHGLPSVERLRAFCDLELPQVQPRLDWVGQPIGGNPTVLVRGRQLFGDDARHLILVYLLGARGTAGLREVANWSHYSQRNLSEILKLLVSSGSLRKESGRYHLTSIRPWEEILQCHAETLRIVDWYAVFDAVVELLRTTERARDHGIELDGIVLSTSRREALEVIRSSGRGGWEDPDGWLSRLRAAVAG